MANNNQMSSAQLQELNELRNRLDWLDEERRKQGRKLSELEQQLALQQRELEGREQRIQELEKQLTGTASQLARQLNLDAELSQFKDDIVDMIEQYDQRRIQSEAEIDRLRRVEHEGTVRELADIRKELPTVNRLQREMELRQAEEARLANLIGGQQGKISALENQVEERKRELTFLEEKEKQNNRQIADLQTRLIETNKRIEPVHERIDLVNSTILRLENSLKSVMETQEKMDASIKSWLEQIQVGEHERQKQMEAWRRVMEEQEDIMARYSREWISISDQYKEAKMAIQTLTQWQEQVEKQQREASELLRVESHRMQSRWDTFRLENEKRWKTFEVEADQRWATANRRERDLQEQISILEETLNNLKQEKDLLKRIQDAQTDAIKRLPLMWVEEVEKAINRNPNRRRQPALVPVREE